MRILVDGSILDDLLATLLELSKLGKSGSQEKHLQVERPTLHVFVEIVKVWIVVHLLKVRLVAVVLGKERSECRLSRPDVSGYGNVHDIGFVQRAK